MEFCLPAVFCLIGGKRAVIYKRMIYENGMFRFSFIV